MFYNKHKDFFNVHYNLLYKELQTKIGPVFIKKFSHLKLKSQEFCLFRFYIALTQYRSWGDFKAKTSGALLCIISGTNGHQSRTTDIQ
jgi:hypothetical protein